MRKHYSAPFKAKVVQELLREEKSLAQLAAEYGVSAKQQTLYRLERNKEMELDRLVMPRTKIQSKIMQPTAGFKNSVLKTRFPVPDFVFDNPVTFDTANGVFNANSHRSEPLINLFVQVRQGFASGLLFGLKYGHIIEAKPLKAGILT